MPIDTDGMNFIRKFLIKEKQPPEEKDFGEIPIGKPQPCVLGSSVFPPPPPSPPPILPQTVTHNGIPVPPNISGVFFPNASSIFASGIMPNNPVYEGVSISDEQIKARYMKMGNRVLRNVEAHETARIGELASVIHEKLTVLKAQMSLTNSQWQQFAELASSITELIGDPYDPESSDAD